MVKKSKIVRYIDSKPLQMCTKLKSRVIRFHPIDAYSNRPSQFENMTFFQYFTKFEYDKMQHSSLQHYHDQDNLRNYIYTTNTLTRFTNFHPTHNIEAFFYNIFLQKTRFWNEIELLSASIHKRTSHSWPFIRIKHHQNILDGICT